ncbi:WD domain, G-beta repeat protein (macronuclear) [Tetrahymena thermophila SB210]|uniref:WD domain, G-beta repeat protein n=1 Tax=Tetrahymena thermophila (strain SB210) TaxID=312017 RepID=Q22KK4_TETTS|nr:WD domain, G-beta repeat protein [Tetrahymena thermophila SB210]EAR85795.2 WD domain, G-beta repeat protein [Tetrahymena thermophila SB210]|eukprot:XP_001033458.2 WD domain, G-beta repeat protein [Tetrahymena thermophila SB210]
MAIKKVTNAENDYFHKENKGWESLVRTFQNSVNRNIISYLMQKNNSIDEYCTIQQYHQNMIQDKENGFKLNFDKEQSLICNQSLKVKLEKKSNALQPLCLMWLNNGKSIAVGYTKAKTTNTSNHQLKGDINIINFYKPQQRQRFFKDIQGLGSMKLLNNGKHIVVGDKVGDIYFLDYILNNLKNQMEDKKSMEDKSDEQKRISTKVQDLVDISPSPTDVKLAIAGGKQISILDIQKEIEEIQLENKTKEITSCEWNPQKALIISTDDSKVRLWDPRDAQNIAELSAHNQPVTVGKWHPNGYNFLTGGKDRAIKLFDIRNLSQPVNTFCSDGEITCLKWHPIQSHIFVSGDSNGNVLHFQTGEQSPIDQQYSDDKIIDIDYHPLGNVMCFIDQKKQLKFYSRDPPKEF